MEELVSSAHARCFNGFESLIDALEQPSRGFQDQISRTDIQDLFVKYTIWAGNVGAAHYGKRYQISLDYRLREASFLKEQVLKLLLTLNGRLSSVTELVRGDRKPNEAQSEESDSEASTSSEIKVDQEESGEESDDSLWEISSGSSSGDGALSQQRNTLQKPNESPLSHGANLKPEFGPKSTISPNSISEIPRLVESIKLAVTCLYRLPIRKPAPLDRVKNSSSIDWILYQRFDVLYVRDKFPNLQLQAATRLGKMITRRRQLLHYREDHKQKLEVTRAQPKVNFHSKTPLQSSSIKADPHVASEDRTNRLASSQAASSHFSLQSKATTTRPGNIESIVFDENIQTSLAPSVAESKSSVASSYAGRDLRIVVPPRPMDENGQELDQFECPYCLIAKSINNDHRWKRHVLEDLQPYVCTYGDCDLYDSFFEDRDTWFKHESQYHRTRWSCNTDNHPDFDSEEEFKSHMWADHDQKFDEAQFNHVKSMFRQPTKSLEGICHMCQRQSKNLRSHISRHLQQIALFALPRANETSGSEQAERNSRSSRSDKNRSVNEESSESSNASENETLDQQSIPLDVTIGNLDIEDLYEEGESIPDAVEDQGWDNVTDKFSKARERSFRRLRVPIFTFGPTNNSRMVSLVESLHCEPIPMGQFTNPEALHNIGQYDVIIISDIYDDREVDSIVRPLRRVTDTPIILLYETRSAIFKPSGFSDLAKLARPSESDIEETLERLCLWAPVPPYWRSETATDFNDDPSDTEIFSAAIKLSTDITSLCAQCPATTEHAKNNVQRVGKIIQSIVLLLAVIEQLSNRLTFLVEMRSFYKELQVLRMRLSSEHASNWSSTSIEVERTVLILEGYIKTFSSPYRVIQITSEIAEDVVIKILRNLENLDDLFSCACINRGFFRVFKRHELELMKLMVWRMSPPAWEYLEICYERDRPQYEYTYYQNFMLSVNNIEDIKKLIRTHGTSTIRPELEAALYSENPEKSKRVNDALWRIESFCKIFGARKDADEWDKSFKRDVELQTAWLEGKINSTRLIPLTNDEDPKESLERIPECFARGNDEMTSEQLLDMIELFKSLHLVLQHYTMPTADSSSQARVYGIFNRFEIGQFRDDQLLLGMLPPPANTYGNC